MSLQIAQIVVDVFAAYALAGLGFALIRAM